MAEKTVIAIEDVMRIQVEIDNINKLDIKDITITQGGKEISLTEEQREGLRFTGLTSFSLIKVAVFGNLE
jgi:hypothetical protein